MSCVHQAHRPRVIAIQPIAFDKPEQILIVQNEISAFFHCPVYILPQAPMPQEFLNMSKGERYSADSLLDWMDRRRSDSISILVGLTNKDIFIRKPGIWGIGDHRFAPADGDLYAHRLRTIVLHEIGHDLGLPHCPTPHCIMHDADGRITTIDSAGTDFCARCKGKL
jgi:archaemetzincin